MLARHSSSCFALALALALPAGVLAADADTPVPAAGRYVLAVQMILPHLDEMRRITVRDERCLTAGQVAGLFPVFDQPALRGCKLEYPKRGAESTDYVLVCESARVATGTAHIITAEDGAIFGLLEVKMGGKNMTFTQRSVAERLGECPSPAPPG